MGGPVKKNENNQVWIIIAVFLGLFIIMALIPQNFWVDLSMKYFQ